MDKSWDETLMLHLQMLEQSAAIRTMLIKAFCARVSKARSQDAEPACLSSGISK